MNRVIYMEVTPDEYALPVCVADSAKELAYMLGIKPSTIRENICRAKRGVKREKYCYVRLDDDDDDDWEDEIYND